MKTILIVDTDLWLLEFLRDKLKALNIQVRLAHGGSRALELLSRQDFDLVISALEMPSPHGIDLLVDLRHRGKNTPMILLSKLFMDSTEVHRRLASIGPYILLDKPIFMNRLYEAVESSLGCKISWEERRLSRRFPVRLPLRTSFIDQVGKLVFVNSTTLDLSMGGLCFQKDVCNLCTGYEPGTVHSDCILFRYSLLSDNSSPLELLITPRQAEPLQVKALVAHLFIQEGTGLELIGVSFIGLNESDQKTLTRILKEYTG
jgi:CheY-like chemotaxis protein